MAGMATKESLISFKIITKNGEVIIPRLETYD